MHNKKSFILGPLLLAMSMAAIADSSVFMDLSHDFGGTQLGEVWFADGQTDEVRANQGLNLAIGIVFPIDSGLELQSSIGLQWSEQAAGNGSMGWHSFPWRTQLVASLGALSLGGGVVWFSSPMLTTEGVLAPLGERRFDNALGYQAELAWRLFPSAENGGMRVGARYTTVDFVAAGETVRGDSAGVFVRFGF